ncbi:hypothetical protein SUGI_1020860 [Cryptomeria japonica]|nr:hypothetical protein SUGI_1020860 [Cryptomeria japonica]
MVNDHNTKLEEPSAVAIVRIWFGKSKTGLFIGICNAHSSGGIICGTLLWTVMVFCYRYIVVWRAALLVEMLVCKGYFRLAGYSAGQRIV